MGVNGIYGLSGSGLDIESLVKMGMSSKNKQYDKLEQQEIANTWLKEAYNDVYMDMTKYKYGTLSTYKMQSNMNAMQASSSNSGVVTATANGAAAAMNHTVEVSSVASNAYLQTAQFRKVGDELVEVKGVTRANAEAQTSNKLTDVIFESFEPGEDSEDGTGNYTVKLKGGEPVEVNGSDIAISLKLKDTAGSDTEYTLTYTYDELYKGEKTLNDFASAIARTGANIQGGYDTANDSFSFYNKTSGADNIIGITAGSDVTNALLNNLNLGSVANDDLGYAEEFEVGTEKTWAGTNATVKIDGKTYNNSTNKLTVAGVTYNFLDATNGAKATISVSQDTDKIVDYVKSFVDEYNTLLDSLNEKLSEKKYSDYKPLSKRQEDEMTEKQIEKWNEKAKSGLLYHNSEIQELVSAMREAIYTKVDAVESEYNTLSSIGITTTNTKGHLTLDTDKLKKALAADPDCVYQLFASDQDSSYIAGSTNKNKITESQKRMDYANTGIANRLDSVMTNHMKKISDIAGTSKDTDDQSYLGKLITQMQSKMESFKTLMTSYENKLYKRYDSMEVALSKLNMQLGYISGSFS